MSDSILVVNAGSSSIKFQLFSVDAGDQLERRLKGQIEGVGIKPHLERRLTGSLPTDEELMIARHTLRVLRSHDKSLSEEKSA